MESIILAIALCGHPATCEVPPVVETHVSIQMTETYHARRPARRILKAVGRAVRFLRPFRRHRCR